jgi:uncharacterized protein
MKNPNITLVQSLYAAFLEGRIDTLVSALAPDVDWQSVGRSKDYPLFGPRKGADAVRDFLRQVAELEEFSEFSPREFYGEGDRVFALGDYAGKVKKTGRTFASEWVHVFTIRNGKVTRFREHTDTAQFAEAYRA